MCLQLSTTFPNDFLRHAMRPQWRSLLRAVLTELSIILTSPAYCPLEVILIFGDKYKLASA